MRRIWRQNARASTPGGWRCGIWMKRSTSIRLLLAQHPVLFEPGLHLAPRVLGRLLAVARAIVGVEAMRCGWVYLELGRLLVGGQRRLEGFHGCDGNAGVGLAVEPEDRRLHVG